MANRKKRTSIIAILIVIMMMSMTATAYVPPELRTGTHMTELEVVKLALAQHDAGKNDRWVVDTLEDAVIHHTNSGRSVNNYAQLREWVTKMENQKAGRFTQITIPPFYKRQYGIEGSGWCAGYDAKCQRWIGSS